MALPMKPLNLDDTLNRKFQWLLEGSQSDMRTLNGSTGHSPLFLYMIAQGTYIAAKISQESTGPSMVVRLRGRGAARPGE